MGFKHQQVGFKYIAEAVFWIMKGRSGRAQTISEIYSLIAKKYRTTKNAVERGIRNAIESVFTEADIDDLHRYYPFDYDEEKGRPNNAEFLKNMAKRLKL